MYISANNLKLRENTSEHPVYASGEYHWKELGKPEGVGSSRSYLAAVDNSYFNGYDIPNFHKRKSAGELLPHTPFKTFSVSGTSNGAFDWTNTFGVHQWYNGNCSVFQNWLLTEDLLSTFAPADYDDYVNEAAGKIYSQGFDALTFIAELGDVKRMFLNVSKTFKNIFGSTDFKKLSGEYLGYRYGWRPLISELKQLYDLVTTYNDKVRTRHSQRSGTHYSSSYISESTTSFDCITVLKLVNDIKYTVSIRGSVTADIEVPKLQFNPIQTAWEVIPLSFVLDWIINVGTFLSSMSFLVHAKAYSASCGYKVHAESTFSTVPLQYSSDYLSGFVYNQTASCVAELIVRQPCSIQFHPSFLLKIDALKIADLVALVTQRIRR